MTNIDPMINESENQSYYVINQVSINYYMNLSNCF